MATRNFSRRDFLKLTSRGLLGLSGILGLAGLIRYLSFEPDPPPPQRFEVGPSSNYPEGSRTLLAEIPAILIHSADGFTAISLTCPHLGCTVEEKDGEMLCPCHGSRYTLDGQLLQGPATKGLKNLTIEIDNDGKITILKG
jgi:cytochrome b6-f complex iron-sulfur subunit